MNPARQLFVGWLFLAALLPANSQAGLRPNFFVFDRMGAGVPAGRPLTWESFQRMAVLMPNPHVLTNPDHFVTQLHSMVEQDMKTSSLSLACLANTGHAAIAMGSWEVDSPFTDPMSLGTTTTLINTDGAWKLAVVGIGPQLSAQER